MSTTPFFLNPRLTCVSCRKESSSKPATNSTTKLNAICAASMGLSAPARAGCLPPDFRASCGETPEARSAGSRANSSVAVVQASSRNASMRQSGCKSRYAGLSDVLSNPTREGAATAANMAASTLAAPASSKPSTSNCRSRRPRPAPIEIRSAISRSRASARAVNRLARLEQAISSSKAATAARIHNGRANVSRKRDGPFGAASTCRLPCRKLSTTARDSSARNPAACSRRKFAYTPCKIGRTASAVTPGFNRPNTINQ